MLYANGKTLILAKILENDKVCCTEFGHMMGIVPVLREVCTELTDHFFYWILQKVLP